MCFQLVRYNSNLVAALKMLIYFHQINKNERKDRLPHKIFIWPELTEFVDIQQEYVHWLLEKNVGF